MNPTPYNSSQIPPAEGISTAENGRFFAQVPQDLIRDRNISRPARLLYALYHSYSPEKKLERRPKTHVGQKTLADVMGCTIQSVSGWQMELIKAGWIDVRRRGHNSNEVRLNPEPRKRVE